MESVFFWIFAVGTVFFSAQVVLRRNPLYAAISLVGAFFFLAGIYVLLSAHLIAILQVIVYAGAVMVLFVFVIMLLNLKEEELGRERLTAWGSSRGERSAMRIPTARRWTWRCAAPRPGSGRSRRSAAPSTSRASCPSR
jgi:uncharacterized MnhB-related membrane protein